MKNAMAINTQKTFYQIFTMSHKKPKITLKINNKPVVQTRDEIYSGMYVDGKLTWINHIQKTTEKIRN
jgi:hypothetical protein